MKVAKCWQALNGIDVGKAAPLDPKIFEVGHATRCIEEDLRYSCCEQERPHMMKRRKNLAPLSDKRGLLGGRQTCLGASHTNAFGVC